MPVDNGYAVYLGAIEWRHPQWQGTLYPEDIPDDWLLTYYNTQFHCVFVPWAVWSALTAEACAAWLVDTREDFRFVLEAPPPGTEHTGHIPRQLGHRLGLIAAKNDPSLIWFDAASDLRVLAQQIASHPKPVYLLSNDGDLQRLEEARSLLELLGL